MTQPPLSTAIAGLEKEIGVPLLRRHARGVETTEAGAFFAQQGEQILAALQQAVDNTRDVGTGRLGQITIASVAMASWQLLPAALAAFGARSPSAGIEVVESLPGEAIERVRSRRAAAALIYCMNTAAIETSLAEGLQLAVIRREPLVVVLPREHPAGRASVVDVADLADLPWVVPSERSSVPGLVELISDTWAKAAIYPAQRRAATVNTIIPMVQAGLGVTVLPSSVSAVAGSAVRLRPPLNRLARIDAVLIWRTEDPAPLLSTFISSVLATPEPDRLDSRHERTSVVVDSDYLAPWAPRALDE